jgi:predicted AAA+ superfamily ATPase
MEEMVSRSLYLDTLLAWRGKPVIKVLCGMRRSGKSSLLELFKNALVKNGLPANDILHINMELMENARYATPESLHQKIKDFFPAAQMQHVLLIDEVQEVTGWERVINSLHAESWCDIIITGSNARLFSGELATLLSGRYVQIPVYGLSFKEFLTFRGIDSENKPATTQEDEFYLWLRWGGMPSLHHINFAANEESSDESTLGLEYLRSILDTILLKDVVLRNKIRDPSFLMQLVRFAFGNIGKLFSAKSVHDWLKTQKQRASIETIQNYVRFLEDAQLIYPLRRADIQGKRLLAYQEKLFIADLGLRHALLGFHMDDIASLLENVVMQELLRRACTVQVGQTSTKEIDFVALKGNEPVYYQVCYLLASPETIERESSALESIKDNFPKIVLSMDRSPRASRNGIQHIYLPAWLLGE